MLSVKISDAMKIWFKGEDSDNFWNNNPCDNKRKFDRWKFVYNDNLGRNGKPTHKMCLHNSIDDQFDEKYCSWRNTLYL
jgi:hypothetical protein